jgi:pyrimidine and pyridine-specific 5'-nucleotidase
MGWSAVHFVEKELDLPVPPASQYQVRDLEKIREVFPQFFKATG